MKPAEWTRLAVVMLGLVCGACDPPRDPAGGDSAVETPGVTAAGDETGGSVYLEYRIHRPEGWTRSGSTGADMTLVSPSEGAGDAFAEYVEIAFASPPGRTHIEEFGAIQIDALRDRHEGFELLSDGRLECAGQPCVKVVYTYDEDGREMKAQAYIFLPKATGLVVRCVATEASYEAYEAGFDAMLASLKFTK